MLVEFGAHFGGQAAEQVFVQKVGEFAAVHALPRSLEYRLRAKEAIFQGFDADVVPQLQGITGHVPQSAAVRVGN